MPESRIELGRVLKTIRNRSIKKGLKLMTEEEILQELERLERKYLKCSFCGRRISEVEYFVNGPDGNICGECVEVAQSIVDKMKKEGLSIQDLLNARGRYEYLRKESRVKKDENLFSNKIQ